MKEQFDLLNNSLKNKKDRKETSRALSFIRSLFYPVIFVGIFVLVFSFQVILSGEGFVENVSEGIKKFSFLNALGLADDRPLKGSEDDRINILLLGMGGLGHSGPFLTDTIIIASIKPSNGDISMLSIPRDLSVPIPGYGWRRINSVNHYGELNNPGNGAAYASDFFSDLLDIPIHYYVRVDFSGFESLIDELGKIDVYVDKTFTDRQYPTKNYGYEIITFEQGWTEMDGKAALKYARSRHGNNGEGSDFARSQRQQKVIKAVKDKALSAGTLFNIRKITALYSNYQQNVSTNLENWEMVSMAQLARDIDDSKIDTLVLDNGSDGLLYSAIINGAYLLMPKDESFYEIQQVAKNIFEPNDFLHRDERVTIEIRNGTKVTGMAYETSVDLTKKGFDVVKIGNASEQTYEKTVIYDFTKGQKPASLERLVGELDANVAPLLPEWLSEDDSDSSIKDSAADFLIIIGQDLALTLQ